MHRKSTFIIIILTLLFIAVNITTYEAQINVSSSTLADYMGTWCETTGNDIELYFTTRDETGLPEITIALLGTESYEIEDMSYDSDSYTYYFVAPTKYLDSDDPNSYTAIGVLWLYGNGIQMEIHYTSNPNAQSYLDTTFYFEKVITGTNIGSYTGSNTGSYGSEGDDYDSYAYYPGTYDPYSGSGESGTYDPYTEELKAFYGVWLDASRSLAYASIVARYLYLPGYYNPQVILSTEWSNLNSEPWFCITAEEYPTQAAAESALADVQEYFPDAYVRYSGEYIGE